MTYEAKPGDIRDKYGRKLVRAREIDGNRWLVYGDDLDTCGAITTDHSGIFNARVRGKCIGKRVILRDAIALLLSPAERKEFG